MLAPDTILQSRYRIVRQLGQGGMGTVYEALDERLATTVALKETHFTDERMRKQFVREARLLARLHHPALPRVSDHFTEGDGQFLVMQFIPGEDLWGMLQRRAGAFPPAEVLGWADQLLDALDYLHTQEPPIIHRDIKPQNLKLTARGQIILLDFGLAKGFAEQASRVATTGSVFGYTPNYAPLEQIQGEGTDARSDLYSLAATLHHLVTGQIPPDVLARAGAVIGGRPDPLRSASELNPHVPAALAAALQRALTIDREQRPASAAVMREALRQAGRSSVGGGAEASALPETILITRHAEKAEDAPPVTSSNTKPAQPQSGHGQPPTTAPPTVAARTAQAPLASTSPAQASTPPRPPTALAEAARKPRRSASLIGPAVLLLAGVIALVMLSKGDSGAPGTNDSESGSTVARPSSASAQTLSLAERPQKIKDQMVERGEQDQASPTLRFVEPREGETIAGSTVNVRLALGGDLKGYKPHKDPATGKGNHIHVILDNQPYEAYYEPDKPFELRNVAEGKHTLRVFPSRPWHESYKNEGAFQMVTFTVKGGGDPSQPTTTTEGKEMMPSTAGEVDRAKPLLTYSRPKGEYKGADAESIMIDFWLAHAKLQGEGGDYRVRYSVDGAAPEYIDKWQPIWLTGWTAGKHTVKLELVGKDGQPVENGGYNTTTREITVTK